MTPDMPDSPGPILFLHIPKTGGTSLINALRLFARPEQCFTEANNRLSYGFVAKLAKERLPPAAIIHGHPDWGACAPMRRQARIITLLREPRQQLVSHFLHALRDPAMPQHVAAKSLGFEAFVRTYPRMITFQTHTLYSAVTDVDCERRQSYADPHYGDALGLDSYAARQMGPVFAFLEEMALVGILEQGQYFLDMLARRAGWSYAPLLPHENATAPDVPAAQSTMPDIIDKLERDPDLAPLFAIERATYAKAKMLSAASLRTDIATEAASGLRFSQAEYRIVHTSDLGEVLLGQNFRPEQQRADWWDRAVAPPPAWWSGNQQLSELVVRRNSLLPCRLTFRADCLHALEPQEVRVCFDNQWLVVQPDRDPDGSIVFSVALPSGSQGNPAHLGLALYLEWNRYPASKPFHPALRITAFSLDAAVAFDRPSAMQAQARSVTS